MPLLATRMVVPLTLAFTPLLLKVICEFSTLITADAADARTPLLVLVLMFELLICMKVPAAPTLTPLTMPSRRTFSSDAVAKPVAATVILTPVLHSVMSVSLMKVVPPATGKAISTPSPVKPQMLQASTVSCLPERNLIPSRPVPAPLICRYFKTILSVDAALIMIALVPAARIPASVPAPLIVIDFVIVTAPKPPGSSTEISPPAAVFEIAPAKVLHGAVRLQGFASSPTPDTQVRVACALASVLHIRHTIETARRFNVNRIFLIY